MSERTLEAYGDSISSLAFDLNDSNKLAVGCWDSHVYLHDLASTSSSPRKLQLRGAVLDVCFDHAGRVYAGGLSNEAVRIDFEAVAVTTIAKHDDAVRCVAFPPALDALVAGSWDQSFSLTSIADPSKSVKFSLAGKVYSMSHSASYLVVALSSRVILLYRLEALKQALESGAPCEPTEQRESSLKFMTRTIRCMPNDQGYVVTSIEGRIAVEWYDADTNGSKKYAFKCHRALVNGIDTVFPVSGLSFNPTFGTFATGGGDGTVSLWDPVAKKRLRQFPKYSAPISAVAFSHDGARLAIAYSEDDEGAQSLAAPAKGNAVVVRETGEEARGKSAAK